jgi:hypothetical protein
MPSQEMIMATLRVKARARPADGKVNQNCAPLPCDSLAQEKDPVRKPADEIPASCGSLREYLKTNH